MAGSIFSFSYRWVQMVDVMWTLFDPCWVEMAHLGERVVDFSMRSAISCRRTF